MKGVERELNEEPLPLPEQTEAVGKAARETAEKVVSELEKEAMNDEHFGEEATSKKGSNVTKQSQQKMVNGASQKYESKQGKEDLVEGNTKKGEPITAGALNRKSQNQDVKEEKKKDAPQDDKLSLPKNLSDDSANQVPKETGDKRNTGPDTENKDREPSNSTNGNTRNRPNNRKEAETQAAQNPNRSLILAEADEDKQMIVVDPEHSTINRKD